MSQFGGEHALAQLLLELARQPGFAKYRLGILVRDLGQQLINQFVRKKRAASQPCSKQLRY
jgi:hypothetical protein